MNGAFYGLIVCGMLIALAYPPVQSELTASIQRAARSGILAEVAHAYERHLWLRGGAADAAGEPDTRQVCCNCTCRR
jgi:Tfp pilus assembly protein PilE